MQGSLAANLDDINANQQPTSCLMDGNRDFKPFFM